MLGRKLRKLGSDFRDVQYSDPEESWIRAGLYIAAVIIFILATIGVFVWKFAYPPSVAVHETDPSKSLISELHQKQANKDISQLTCPCSNSAIMRDVGFEDYAEAWQRFGSLCALYSNGTLSSSSDCSTGGPCDSQFSALCYSIHDLIGETMIYDKPITTNVAVSKSEYFALTEKIWSTNSRNGAWQLKVMFVNYFWWAVIRMPVCDYSSNCDWYIDGNVFADTTDFVYFVWDLLDTSGANDLKSDWYKDYDRTTTYDSFLDICAPDYCNYMEPQGAVDNVMDAIAVLGSIWGILLLIAGTTYSLLVTYVIKGGDKYAANDTPMN